MSREIRNYENMRPELQTMYKINQNVSLAELGDLVNEAMTLADCGDAETSRDCLIDVISEMHTKLFPNASRKPTPEDNRRLVLNLLDGAMEELTKDVADGDHAIMLISEAYAGIEDLSLK